jgi:hypothetical protein
MKTLFQCPRVLTAAAGRRAGAAALTLLLAGLPLGCDFFDELESDPIESTSTDGGDGDGDGDGDGHCGLEDDRCASQDLLTSCDLATGTLTDYNCASVCGASLNFTCLSSGNGQHGCWCVQPASIALDGCADLEVCVSECATPECSSACFSRASTPTIRLLGALFHCAESDCEDLCKESAEVCNSCILATRAGVYGGCGVERSVCDADTVDEIPWPSP